MKKINLLPLVIVVALAACGPKTSTESGSAKPSAPASAVAPETAPAASVVTPAPAPAAPAAVASAGDLDKGEKVYTANCLSCHGAGVLGAPKFGDKAAWEPRIAKGKDALYTSSLSGFKMMPPKGGNAALKDEEVKAAVDYMVSKAI